MRWFDGVEKSVQCKVNETEKCEGELLEQRAVLMC